MPNDDINFYFIIGGSICGYAVAVWIQNFFPIELRENGITIAGSLIKWSRIKAYEWTALERLVLKLKPKYLSWQRKWTVRVSSARRERDEQILSEKLSNQKNHETSQ